MDNKQLAIQDKNPRVWRLPIDELKSSTPNSTILEQSQQEPTSSNSMKTTLNQESMQKALQNILVMKYLATQTVRQHNKGKILSNNHFHLSRYLVEPQNIRKDFDFLFFS